MTAAPHSPLFIAIRHAIQTHLRFVPLGNDYGIGIDSDHAAQAALDACHAKEMLAVLRRVADWADGGDTLNGCFSEVRALLAKLDGRSPPPPCLGYCPTCGAAGRSREKRPFGDDLCEAGHRCPSSTALSAKPEGGS